MQLVFTYVSLEVIGDRPAAEVWGSVAPPQEGPGPQ